MNQKRSCPGVPNRYSHSPSRMVIRPKSSATVVVTLPDTAEVSSIPMLRSVRNSSVCSGRISLIVPTRVVLPTPKPPAMRILIAMGGGAVAAVGSEAAKSMQHFRVESLVERLSHRSRTIDGHQSLTPQVAEDHPGDVERQLELGRHVGHRGGPAAHLQQLHLLRDQVAGVRRTSATGGARNQP